MTTTPTFWSNEVTLSHDPSTFEPHLTALADDTFAVSWSAGGDIFGFKLDFIRELHHRQSAGGSFAVDRRSAERRAAHRTDRREIVVRVPLRS